MSMSFEESFENIGARLKVQRIPVAWQQFDSPVRIDIDRDSNGEFFQIDHVSDVRVTVPDEDPADRHLLLRVEEPGYVTRFSLFLCGHDERAWFVATINDPQVETVAQAKDSLKPREVWTEIRKYDLPPEQWNLRCTAAFVRQGEWFFLPRPWLKVNDREVLVDEPISRGGGKPHSCEFLYRVGGDLVYVNDEFPNGITEEQYRSLNASIQARSGYWNQRRRDAKVFVRGMVRHPDHATINLPYWHKVVMNTEANSASQYVAFLD
jgi:hypothetical protein